MSKMSNNIIRNLARTKTKCEHQQTYPIIFEFNRSKTHVKNSAMMTEPKQKQRL